MKKNWLSNYFIQFQSLTKDILIDRTNNIAESFNKVMNNDIKSSHFHD